jgi:hypothetical protein
MRRFFSVLLKIVIVIFALVGLAFTSVFFGMKYGIFNVRGSIADRNSFFGATPAPKAVAAPVCSDKQKTCDWNTTPEWAVIKGGLEKDADIIKRVAAETGVSARMIAAVVVPEQTRFFTANREIFKSYFEPLKLLGSLTQFSLGVSGIKQETALNIEKYASDPTSQFYPGNGMAELFAYPEGIDQGAELYNRLTDAKDHYYQYLYSGLYIKEIQMQWMMAGYDISRNPGAVVTLFNLGFKASYPKATPRAAGAPITTGGKVYVYGELGALFYDSNELADVFLQ